MGMARLVSLGIVAALIACLGITFYQVIAPFLMPLFLAAMIALLCQPVLRYFLSRCKGRRSLAAGLATASIVGSVMLPIVVAVLMGILQFLTVEDIALDTGRRVVSGEIREMRERLTKVADLSYGWVFPSKHVSAIDRQIFGQVEATQLAQAEAEFDNTEQQGPGPLESARRRWLLERVERTRSQAIEMMKALALKTAGVVGSTLSSALNRTVDLLGACVGALVALFVFTLALYYFLLDGPDMVIAAQSLIPVDQAHQQELMQQFALSVRAVVVATFLAAVGQGIATSIALQFVGMGHFFLFAIIATFAALIPMAGTWLVWMPCAIWLGAVNGSWGLAIFLIVVGIGPIGMMDNFIRAWVLKNDTSLHPLLAFVSVLGGLQVMGLWGVFIGPIVACCLHSLIEIFNSELREASPVEPTTEAPHQRPETASVKLTGEETAPGPNGENKSATQHSEGADSESDASEIPEPCDSPEADEAKTKPSDS
ncbi:MAG: AI-2E family transporter [Planctomycetota bacterium]|jgi:predicted PurR-regulated permease PerM